MRKATFPVSPDLNDFTWRQLCHMTKRIDPTSIAPDLPSLLSFALFI